MASKRSHRWPLSGPTIDRLIIGSLVTVDIVGMVAATAGGKVKSPPLRPYEFIAAIAAAGIFWWRRKYPLTVLLMALVAIPVAALPHHVALLSQSTGLSIAVATYAVGSWGKPRVASMGIPAVMFTLLFIATKYGGWGWSVSAAIPAAVIALPWVTGYAARSRRLYLEEVEERLATVERDRDERSRQAARDERAHIARELHDIVAHHVSVIGVQAGAARMSLDSSPSDAKKALTVIESASREAVGEMQHLLSALRDQNGSAAQIDSPQPGLSELEHLVESFRVTGMTVALAVSGTDTPLPPSLDLCCYRIVEEALTNVARHSAAGRADVQVDVGPSSVHIAVRDPGPTAGQPGTGRGHVGMRERVNLFGGTLFVGPDSSGSYRVEATLPRNKAGVP
jgi:signal transduction histidine kinase